MNKVSTIDKKFNGEEDNMPNTKISIEFDNPLRVFFTGQQVTGTVKIIVPDEPLSTKFIEVTLTYLTYTQ